MISSRRLAREWALKILYQIDVGKTGIDEAQSDALDKLRMEFVQRGSRVASGSTLEGICLDYLTSQLTDALPAMRPPLERACAVAGGLVVREIPYWQEVRLETSLRTKFPGVHLNPPRLIAPVSASRYFPIEADSTDPFHQAYADLTPLERKLYREFVERSRDELPRLLDRSLRKTGLAFARQFADSRPAALAGFELQAWVSSRRNAAVEDAEARWGKIVPIVEKQIGDWLRTAVYTVSVLQGVFEQQAEIDRALTELSAGWRLERQVSVDRNIMRMAAYEMLFMSGVPTGASINEAVELAKKYSTAESGRFVNGVLGALATRISGSRRTVETADPEAPDTELDLPEVSEIEEMDPPEVSEIEEMGGE